jgi:drug/metabolite transporter (DMT)-like permease
MPFASVALAVLAAALNAVSSVLQRRANRAQDSSAKFGPRLLVSLVRNKSWILGLAAMTMSFVLQAAALGLGDLSVVEPIIALELPFTLVLATQVFGSALTAGEWLAFAAMTGGLALLLGALAPHGGSADGTDFWALLLALVATVGAAAVLCIGAAVLRGGRRAALFGVAAGTLFGLTASLIKAAVDRLQDGGVIGALTDWTTYTFPVTGILGVVIVQAALHAGTLVAAQPGFTLADPIVSILWGTLVYNEQTRTGFLALAAASVGMVVIGVGVVRLVRSPAFEASARDEEPAPTGMRSAEARAGG